MPDATAPRRFLEELRIQRWDDHRYYHQSRVNQALHLLSACCFLTAYALIPFQPAVAAILGWVVAMWIRQVGHFFFEPRGFDQVNHATFAHKEDIKLGYNLRRKVVLLVVWATIPVVAWRDPSLFGLMTPWHDRTSYVDQVGILWLWLGVAGLLARTLWLCATRGAQTGLAWMTKILTDPFHDIALYHTAPAALLRGEWIDPMTHVAEPGASRDHHATPAATPAARDA